MKTRVATLLLAAFALGASVAVSAEVDLVVEPTEVTISSGGALPVSVRIVNRGPDDVTLVKPGDGSSEGWRTPVIGWWVADARLTEKTHPPHIAEAATVRCGNINRLRLEEVVVLRAGEAMKLGEWLHFPKLERPGRFRVALHYRNVPDLEWEGLVLGEHDPEAMGLVRKSTEVSLWSDDIMVTVTDDHD